MFGKTKRVVQRLEDHCDWLEKRLDEVERAHARLVSELGLRERKIYEHWIFVKTPSKKVSE